LIVTVVVIIARRYVGTKEGRYNVDKYKLRLPVIKGLTQKVISARFTRTMATLLASGISLLEAMENVAGAVGNTVVQQSIMSAREDVRKGIALSVPIRKMGHFPPMVDSMIKIGILDGDYIIVRQQNTANNGDIVVALIDDEDATVKRFFKEDNHIRLQPENDTLQPIYAENVSILGKVIGLFRNI
jgi:hypothetical protein